MKIEILDIDITTLEIDAIVNAANPTLSGGGGVDGAIHRAAGPKLLEKCKTLNGCKTGEAKITDGYNLPARFVIHTVGPIWHGGDKNEETLLSDCYKNTLALAERNNIKSIAFPAISCGVYGFPAPQACLIAMKEVLNFAQDSRVLEKVVFACFNPEVEQGLRQAKEKLTLSTN